MKTQVGFLKFDFYFYKCYNKRVVTQKEDL